MKGEDLSVVKGERHRSEWQGVKEQKRWSQCVGA